MEEATSTKFCEEIVATAHRIILPTPVSKLKKTQVAIFRQYFHPEQWVIGGKFDAELEKELQRKQIPYLDFMKEETVAADSYI